MSDSGGAYAYYLDEEGRPQLHQSVACHLDGLGTSEQIRQLTNDSLRGLRRQEYLTSLFQDRSEPDPLALVRTFTDNVVVGLPVDGEPQDFLATMASWCAVYQTSMAIHHRTPLRGGIAIGELFMDDRYVTGPALLEAVKLEHDVADVPRIVLSGESVALALDRPPNTGSWNDMLRVDADGWVFVDYLSHFLGTTEENVSLQIGHLAAHAELIKTGLRSHDSGRVRVKYIWMAAYHNDFVRRALKGDPQYMVVEEIGHTEAKFARVFRDFDET